MKHYATSLVRENIIYEPGVTYVADPNDNWWKENRPEIGKAVTAAGRADDNSLYRREYVL